MSYAKTLTIHYSLFRQLQGEHEEIIFPGAFIYPVGKISVESHGKQSGYKNTELIVAYNNILSLRKSFRHNNLVFGSFYLFLLYKGQQVLHFVFFNSYK